jgi:hypothetical protein
MAKRECPFCKEKVKEDAIICMHCKSELPPLPPKKWYQTWKGLFLILFVLGIFGQAFDDRSAKSTTSTKATNSIAANASNQAPPEKAKTSDGKKITDKNLARKLAVATYYEQFLQQTYGMVIVSVQGQKNEVLQISMLVIPNGRIQSILDSGVYKEAKKTQFNKIVFIDADKKRTTVELQ